VMSLNGMVVGIRKFFFEIPGSNILVEESGSADFPVILSRSRQLLGHTLMINQIQINGFNMKERL
jgi:hypothetical protein